jgi:hypothetical protein
MQADTVDMGNTTTSPELGCSLFGGSAFDVWKQVAFCG